MLRVHICLSPGWKLWFLQFPQNWGTKGQLSGQLPTNAPKHAMKSLENAKRYGTGQRPAAPGGAAEPVLVSTGAAQGSSASWALPCVLRILYTVPTPGLPDSRASRLDVSPFLQAALLPATAAEPA